MRILHREMELREETRALEQAEPALEPDAYSTQANSLADTQRELVSRVGDVMEKIRELPDGPVNFARDIAILSRVEEVMREARRLLASPETGPETIAAETEAIELLLQARRINPKGGGSGGASPGGGGTGNTDQSALALLGSGEESEAVYSPRSVRQATGLSGVELPAEYRHGLDLFFEALDKSGTAGANCVLEHVTKLAHREQPFGEVKWGMLECWNVGMLECWNAGVLECWSVGVLNLPRIQKFKATPLPHHSSPRRPFLVLLQPLSAESLAPPR